MLDPVIPSKEFPAVDEVISDVPKFDVAPLTGQGQCYERFNSKNHMVFHEDAFGLTDNVPGIDGLIELSVLLSPANAQLHGMRAAIQCSRTHR